jgi:hypothetical protein
VSETLLQELLDREEIKELKARFYRLMDERDWEGWRELFTDDFHADLLDGWRVVEGGEEFVAQTRRSFDGVRSAHYGHMPEIELAGPTEARGVWASIDYLEWPPDAETGERNGAVGYGHERETYRKVDGAWRIASYRLTYLRWDALPREPLPEIGPAVQS